MTLDESEMVRAATRLKAERLVQAGKDSLATLFAEGSIEIVELSGRHYLGVWSDDRSVVYGKYLKAASLVNTGQNAIEILAAGGSIEDAEKAMNNRKAS